MYVLNERPCKPPRAILKLSVCTVGLPVRITRSEAVRLHSRITRPDNSFQDASVKSTSSASAGFFNLMPLDVLLFLGVVHVGKRSKRERERERERTLAHGQKSQSPFDSSMIINHRTAFSDVPYLTKIKTCQ